MIKYLAALALNLGIVAQLHAQGYIVPNGVVSNFDGEFFSGEIDVLHNPANPTNGSSYTGFTFQPNGKTPPTFPFANIFQFDPVADIGVRVFLVSPNDPISLQTILAMNYPEFTSENNYTFNPGTPFYVGLYTGNVQFAPPNGIYNDPLFGWAELENVGGTVELLNSALEYQGGGIFAGTENIVAPEPTTLSLVILGTAGMFALRWGFKRSSRPDSVREAA